LLKTKSFLAKIDGKWIKKFIKTVKWNLGVEKKSIIELKGINIRFSELYNETRNT
jgi:hypothetical protein